MKKIFFLIVIVFFVGCSSSEKELYEITDSFVESLQLEYESYGALGGRKYMTITTDSLYQVMPVGRLINVKILEVVEDGVYEELRDDLKGHYKNDIRVNDVYISQGGTVMIDCRN